MFLINELESQIPASSNMPNMWPPDIDIDPLKRWSVSIRHIYDGTIKEKFPLFHGSSRGEPGFANPDFNLSYSPSASS